MSSVITTSCVASLTYLPAFSLATTALLSRHDRLGLAVGAQRRRARMQRHREFLMYHKSRIYPAYLLAYQRVMPVVTV